MDGISYLLDYNRRQSEEYCSADAALSRQRYLERYPTAISALKCMDGRLNLPYITETPPGLIQAWRTIGGKFDLGWPHFGDLMTDWVTRSRAEGRECLVLISYHFSQGSQERGCRGFGYATEAASAYVVRLRDQFERVYGSDHQAVYPVCIGIETDEDALIVHGAAGEALAVADVSDPREIIDRLARMFPDMQPGMLADFAHLLHGNHAHIASVREEARPLGEIEHSEWVIGIGRGYDWLHKPNVALLVGAYDFDLARSVRTATDIVYANLQEGRLDPERGIVLMASSPCWEPEGSMAWRQMVEKSTSLADLAYGAIKDHRPELLEHMDVLSGVTDMQRRFFVRQEFPGLSLMR